MLLSGRGDDAELRGWAQGPFWREEARRKLNPALNAGARVLILDEPSKVLAPQEAERLFEVVLELADDGYGLVLITHKLREAKACARVREAFSTEASVL